MSWLDCLLDFVLDPVEELVLALGPVGIGRGLGPGTCTSTWVRPVLVDGCCGWVRRSGVCCGFGCGLGFGSDFCDSLSLSSSWPAVPVAAAASLASSLVALFPFCPPPA